VRGFLADGSVTPLSGSLVVLGLVIATVVLLYFMRRSVLKVPKSFDTPQKPDLTTRDQDGRGPA
jgi:hypothetical protein